MNKINEKKHLYLPKGLRNSAIIFAGLLVLVSVFSFAKPAFTAAPGDVLINEIFTNPSSGQEWYELFNTTGSNIDLSGWTINRAVTSDAISLSGTLPANGIRVFSVTNAHENDAGDVLTLKDGTAADIAVLSYGNQPAPTPHAAVPGSDQAAYISDYTLGALVYSVGTPTKGWFNNATDWTCLQLSGTGSPATPPTLSSIATCLSSASGVVTNMGSLADPSAATNLSFEKRTDVADAATAIGKIVFAGPLNLTDQNTVNYLKAAGQRLDMAASGGEVRVGLNTTVSGVAGTTESNFKNAAATLTMYGLTAIHAAPNLIVKNNAGTVIPSSDGVNYPTITTSGPGLGFDDGAHTFTFTTNHFTTFESDSTQVTPTFSPVAGAVAFGSTVTITSSGADHIYYTTDGTDPATSVGGSTSEYGAPVTISAATTLKAIATKTGLLDSAIGSAAYTQAASANLSDIALSGTPGNYTFAAGTYTYNSVTVANGVASITVTPTGAGVITMSLDGGAPATLTSGVASDAIALTAGVEKAITVIATETGKSAKTYTINVTRALSSAKAITAFSFSSGTGVINEASHTIAVNVSNGTNVTALVATFTNTGSSITVGATPQVSATTANNFTSAKTYTVAAANSTTQDYVVTVTVLPANQIPAAPAVSVDTVQKEVVVDSSVGTTITVPSNVTDATINVDSLTTDNGSVTTATLPAITLNVTTSLSATAVNVAIPDSTIVTAPTGWDGMELSMFQQ
jgi:hypothetical protein